MMAAKPKRKGPGRPTKLTPEVQERLLTALRAGNFRGPSAFYAGIGDKTLSTWMKEGKQNPEGPFGALRRAVLEAENGAEIANVAHIAKAATKDWKAAAWWLERKAHERFGRRDRTEVTGPGGGAVEVVVRQYGPGDEEP